MGNPSKWANITVNLLIVLFAIPFNITAQADRNPVNVTKWINSTFAKGHIPPFSFFYNGKQSASFITKWKYSVKKVISSDSQVIKFLYTYTDQATRLQVNCRVSGYTAFQAVEWVMDFTNTSGKNSGVLKNVKVIQYTLHYTNDGSFMLHYALGSNAKRSDFQPVSTKLDAQKSMYFTPEGGRSSNTTGFPFFNIESPDKKGAVIAIGWSGNWYAEFAQRQYKAVSVVSGMKNMNLFLYPHESIRTPSICMLFWQGENRMAGNNNFRRFILAHHSRLVHGKFAEYPLSAGFQAGAPSPCNENSCLTEEFALAIIHRYRQFNIVPELFWLDAGWYTGCAGPNEEGRDWYNQVGNWTADTTRFPHGLKPISDAAHQLGAKFMVWFEPERARRGSQFALEHPEWMLKVPDIDNDNFLFDLGNKEACEWLINYMSRLIVDNGIDYYRQDLNMNPAPYWTANDEAGRTGIKEIRHMEGLYDFWDRLLIKFPNLLIDNCAGGGRRLDLETTSRSAPLWRTDYQYGEPNGYQNHTYGLSFWLPLNGTGAFAADTFAFRSSISSAMTIAWPITIAQGSVPEMQHIMHAYKEIQPYFYQDYYPLTGTGDLTGDDVWLAYQFHKSSDNSGIVVAFRRKEAKNNHLIVSLSGLSKALNYEIRNDNDGKTTTRSGEELESGLDLELLNAPQSLLLQYKVKQ